MPFTSFVASKIYKATEQNIGPLQSAQRVDFSALLL